MSICLSYLVGENNRTCSGAKPASMYHFYANNELQPTGPNNLGQNFVEKLVKGLIAPIIIH